MRLRIAVDLHDDIGASLSRIAILSEVVRRQAAGGGSNVDGPLARIATTSREVVDAMNDIVWAITPHHDSLDDLTRRMRRFASDVLASRGVDLQFAARPTAWRSLGHDVRRPPCSCSRSRSPTSAAMPVFAGLDRARASSDALTLAVRDKPVSTRPRRGVGHGLANMRRRVRELGGGWRVHRAPAPGRRSWSQPTRARLSFDYAQVVVWPCKAE